MIEIALGALVTVAATAIYLGAGEALGLPLRNLAVLLGSSGIAAIAGAGLLLAGRGAYRLARRGRTGGQHALRTNALAWIAVALVALFGLALPLSVGTLNAVRIAGFPLGFYVAAQGSLIALVIVAFAVVAKQDAIDVADGAGSSGEAGSATD